MRRPALVQPRSAGFLLIARDCAGPRFLDYLEPWRVLHRVAAWPRRRCAGIRVGNWFRQPAAEVVPWQPSDPAAVLGGGTGIAPDSSFASAASCRGEHRER